MKKLLLFGLLLAGVLIQSIHAQNFVFGMAGRSSGGGSGNATVPTDAVVQPGQAFVDVMAILAAQNLNSYYDFNFANKGVSKISPLIQAVWDNISVLPDLNISGGSCGTTEINAILAIYAANPTGGNGAFVLNLSGGTNAAPTGQGVTDKATLISNGWTVTTN